MLKIPQNVKSLSLKDDIGTYSLQNENLVRSAAKSAV